MATCFLKIIDPLCSYVFLLISALAVTIGIVFLIQLRNISAPLNDEIPLSIERLNHTSEIDGLVQLMRYYDEVLTQSARNYTFTGDKQWERRYHAFKPDLDDVIDQVIEKSDETNREIFKGIHEANLALIEMHRSALEHANEGDFSAAGQILQSDEYWAQKRLYESGLRDYFSKRGIGYERAFESSAITVKLAAKNAQEALRTSINLTITFIFLTIVISVGVSILIARSIARPLRSLTDYAQRIGKGDLSRQVPVSSNNEIGDLARTLNKMTLDLQNTTVSRDELAGEVERRKGAEEELERQVQDLARSNAELEQFAYVASHDLQEPLRMVTSYTQLLAKRYKDKLDSNANEFISFAVEGATRMGKLINDLLAYSRVGTHGNSLGPTDAKAILHEALANLLMAIKENEAVITHDQLPNVIADRGQMGRLFQNLIGNAIKFRNESPPQVHISAQQKEDEWVFSVRDNGIGIDPEFAERIFIIFQRLHTREEYSGNGMGLAVCKKIVERHSGHIWVESQPGNGATFYFTIPIRNGKQI